MNFLPIFSAWTFALAGTICAAGPVIIHLLNRRRFRVVEWAAMQFLREALQRSRRIVQLRDLLLMVMRTLAVLLFGLALARPHFTSRGEHFDAGQPVHAVLLIDNSLSMGHQTLEGTVLDQAKQRAATFVEKLPVGSKISVVPLCGTQNAVSPEPYDTKPFALEAVQRIEVVDRSASVRHAINEARRVGAAESNLAKRFVLFTDEQQLNWDDAGALFNDPELPPLQIVQIATENYDNTWVSDVRVQDGVADAETPTLIHVVVTHRGREPRGDVRVALHVNGEEVDAHMIALDAADVSREVTFEHTFRECHPEASAPEYIPIKVSLTPDRLVEDDERHLMVPVVAALPVTFVDQYSDDEENPVENRLGETRHLRNLLAPSGTGEVESRQLVQVRHRRIEQLERDTIADARLVVIAGISSPGDKVDVLREYVEQGGQLMIAAGAEFDAEAWNEAAWRDGQGILPLPLNTEPLGTLPEVAGSRLEPFFLSYESLGQSPYFQLAGNSEQDLRDLYAEPYFFKAVRVEATPEILDDLQNATTRQLEVLREQANPERTGKDAGGASPPGSWLLWSPPQSEASMFVTAEEPAEQKRRLAMLAKEFQPQVLARFSSETGPAFLVERRIGLGRVLFASSGLLSSWNTLPKSNAIVLFDRILREMIQSTLPQRNYVGVDRIAVPLPDAARDAQVVLARPGATAAEEPLDSGFLAKDHVGVTVDHPLARGLYRLSARSAQQDGTVQTNLPPPWQLAITVNGEAEESDLTPLDRPMVESQITGDSLRWVGKDDEISLAGARIRGQDMWWWLALIVLLVLLAELGGLVLFGRRDVIPVAANR